MSAAVEGLKRGGVRRQLYTSGAPLAGDWDKQWPENLHTLRSEYFNSDDQLLTLRMFSGYPDPDIWTFASRNDLLDQHRNGRLGLERCTPESPQ